MDHLPDGCLIISGVNLVLESLSKYLDSFLKRYVWKIKTNIKDMTGFISKIEKLAVTTSVLLTMDVSSYTNMPHEDSRQVRECSTL